MPKWFVSAFLKLHPEPPEEIILDLDANTLTHVATGKVHRLRPLGDAGPVIDAGGLFAYARQTGMIPPTSPVTILDPGPSAGPED